MANVCLLLCCRCVFCWRDLWRSQRRAPVTLTSLSNNRFGHKPDANGRGFPALWSHRITSSVVTCHAVWVLWLVFISHHVKFLQMEPLALCYPCTRDRFLCCALTCHTVLNNARVENHEHIFIAQDLIVPSFLNEFFFYSFLHPNTRIQEWLNF